MALSGKIPGSRRALRKARKVDRNKRSKTIRYRYLIACEGKETEPNYFTALGRLIPKDIAIIAKGDGRNTLSLVEWAEKEKKSY
jgi:hydroxylamine reductase (hybrid-cluster protein)